MGGMGLLLACAAQAQRSGQKEQYSHQLTITSDNDFYLAQYNDRYYTNGIFINYAWAAKDTLHKKINALELGQLMFNPNDYLKSGTAVIDRPYAGYLYLSGSQTRFLQHDQVLTLGVTLGITGKPSLAEALQNWYHHIAGFRHPTGWVYQVTTEPSLNLHARYIATVISSESGSFALKPVLELHAGNAFTNAQFGAMLQLGTFEKNKETALWNAGIGRGSSATQKPYELFLYFHPELIVQGYNATVQGGLFRQDKGFTRSLETLEPVFTLGAMYARNRFVLNAAAVYQGRETPYQLVPQQYGTLQVGYRFN